MKHPAFESDGRILIAEVEVADTVLGRMRGYLGRDNPGPGHGLLLNPCGSVHTFGMRFVLDLIFLSREGAVCKVLAAVAPGRIAWGGWRAHHVIETPAGWLDLSLLPMGARVRPMPLAA